MVGDLARPLNDLPALTRRRLLRLAVPGLMLVGCAGAPSEADRGAFRFVAPGGQVEIRYDPPGSRGRIGPLAAPDLRDLTRTIDLADLRGSVVVLNVWGSWCAPCREEAPELQQVQDATAPKGVTVLGIAVRDDADAARDFLDSRSLTYPSLFDPPARTLTALRGFPRNTVPSTVVLDRSHRVAAIFLTTVRVARLMPVVQDVAAEPHPEPPTDSPTDPPADLQGE